MHQISKIQPHLVTYKTLKSTTNCEQLQRYITFDRDDVVSRMTTVHNHAEWSSAASINIFFSPAVENRVVASRARR